MRLGILISVREIVWLGVLSSWSISPMEQLLVIGLLPICFGLKKLVKGTCFGGLWSASVVIGKARYLACGLLVSGLFCLAGFLEVEAHNKISHRFVGLQNALITSFRCRNVMLLLLPQKSKFVEIILGTVWSCG